MTPVGRVPCWKVGIAVYRSEAQGIVNERCGMLGQKNIRLTSLFLSFSAVTDLQLYYCRCSCTDAVLTANDDVLCRAFLRKELPACWTFFWAPLYSSPARICATPYLRTL